MPSTYAEQNAKILEELARRLEEERALALEQENMRLKAERDLANRLIEEEVQIVLQDDVKTPTSIPDEGGLYLKYILPFLAGILGVGYIFKNLIDSSSKDSSAASSSNNAESTSHMPDAALSPSLPLHPPVSPSEPLPSEMGQFKRGLTGAMAQRFEDRDKGIKLTSPEQSDVESQRLREDAATGNPHVEPRQITEGAKHTGDTPPPAPSIESIPSVKAESALSETGALTVFLASHKWELLISAVIVAFIIEEYYNDYPVINGIKNICNNAWESLPQIYPNYVADNIDNTFNFVYNSYSDTTPLLKSHEYLPDEIT